MKTATSIALSLILASHIASADTNNATKECVDAHFSENIIKISELYKLTQKAKGTEDFTSHIERLRMATIDAKKAHEKLLALFKAKGIEPASEYYQGQERILDGYDKTVEQIKNLIMGLQSKQL